ncbi:metal-dependent transcriptional regulator [Halodesulfurarchaeum sp. HSR-GB]|uniref:metal-dependent transcriptional regulator n=1 Tax=Halodesulfurarchaeum sp. HSR-GB TaxID=3074077 RepID=UPI00285AE4D5|nr:metal-dependent transcriptional regulator [Halodesulfurarchaeum sp. HSR-GB]MDR5656541.1 metal-dependent transcriptional regulator [Halodesulfurarchaeum sp. HSR-GB]
MSRTDQPDPVADLPNRNAGRYLRSILAAVSGPDEEVRPSHIADRLGVTPASVTEMTRRLAADGYVDHEPYGGISLTRKGALMARHLQWRQCVFTQFFEESLDVSIPETASYEASFALPAAVIDEARAYVGIDCEDRCDERIWETPCENVPGQAIEGSGPAETAGQS